MVSKRYQYPERNQYPAVYQRKNDIVMGPVHSKEACTESLEAVRDALYVLNGKWKLPIIIALSTSARRFRELHRLLEGITPKVLSKELKELELNEFVVRKVYDSSPVVVEYSLTPYSSSLDKVIECLRDWGMQHRKRLYASHKKQRMAAVD